MRDEAVGSTWLRSEVGRRAVRFRLCIYPAADALSPLVRPTRPERPCKNSKPSAPEEDRPRERIRDGADGRRNGQQAMNQYDNEEELRKPQAGSE